MFVFRDQDIIYELVPDVMKESTILVNSILPLFSVDFANNCVVIDDKAISRL